MSLIRVELPAPLLRHAKIASGHEVSLEIEAPVTLTRVLDALEDAHPTLRGTIRYPLMSSRDVNR
jgi:hypothetical protein